MHDSCYISYKKKQTFCIVTVITVHLLYIHVYNTHNIFDYIFFIRLKTFIYIKLTHSDIHRLRHMDAHCFPVVVF